MKNSTRENHGERTNIIKILGGGVDKIWWLIVVNERQVGIKCWFWVSYIEDYVDGGTIWNKKTDLGKDSDLTFESIKFKYLYYNQQVLETWTWNYGMRHKLYMYRFRNYHHGC